MNIEFCKNHKKINLFCLNSAYYLIYSVNFIEIKDMI